MARRRIQDGVLVANEDSSRIFKKNCLVVKMDFQKAFDCVSWRYLTYLITRMEFGS